MRRLARDERADLAAFLMTLSPQQWQAPTLRARWPVRGVVAHVISDDELDPRSLLACVVQGRSRPDRVNAAALARYSTRSPGQLLALLTDHLQPHGLPAALGGRVALVEGVIHRQVIRRARTAWRHPARTAAARAGVGADRPGHRRVVAYPRAAPGRHRSQLFRRSRAGGAGRGRGAAGGQRLIVLLRWTMADLVPELQRAV
jgi:uncharacterized protein (TIGR03083 family)